MRTAILSPHVDDAIFSLGDFIQSLNDVTIITPFAGIPADPGGLKKHITLRKEHERACDVLGVEYINGDFFDDVYHPRPTPMQLREFLATALQPFDDIIAPIGIHHPDHILLRETVKGLGFVSRWYMDLPYATLYPEIRARLVLERFKFGNIHRFYENVTGLKKKAVMCYESQLQNDHVLQEIIGQHEELYD